MFAAYQTFVHASVAAAADDSRPHPCIKWTAFNHIDRSVHAWYQKLVFHTALYITMR